MNQGTEPVQGDGRNLDNDELWTQLKNAINLRSAEDHVIWNIFGIFWAASALLLVALFRTGDFPENSAVGIIISGVGLSLSIAWSLIQRRSLGHIKRHEKLMKRLEQKLEFDPDYAVSAEINTEDYDQCVGKGPAARTVMTWFSRAPIIGWGVFLTYFIWRC